MLIQRILPLDRTDDLKPARSFRPPARQLAPSEKPSSDLPRSEFLRLVQEKIKKGYYNSEPVIDDLSDSMAGAFNKLV